MPALEPGAIVTVFGGAGYIGWHVCRLLLAEGFQVRLFDNFLFGSDGIAELPSHNLRVIEADICDTAAVSAACNRADAVIVLSAIAGHRFQDVRSVSIRNINYLASSVVLDAAVEHGVSRFIFASTNSVYGTQSGVMYETTIPEPVSLYARLKLRMEERVIGARSREFHPTALRIATCHGFSPRMRFDIVANRLIRDATIRRAIAINSGEQWRAFIHVEDCARSFVSCLKAHLNLISGQVFNVGVKDQNIQLHQLANIIKSVVPEVEVSVLPGEPDLPDFHLNYSRIEKILDFQPKWTLESSLVQVRDKIREGYFADPYAMRFTNT